MNSNAASLLVLRAAIHTFRLARILDAIGEDATMATRDAKLLRQLGRSMSPKAGRPSKGDSK